MTWMLLDHWNDHVDDDSFSFHFHCSLSLLLLFPRLPSVFIFFTISLQILRNFIHFCFFHYFSSFFISTFTCLFEHLFFKSLSLSGFHQMIDTNVLDTVVHVVQRWRVKECSLKSIWPGESGKGILLATFKSKVLQELHLIDSVTTRNVFSVLFLYEPFPLF